MSAVTKGGTKFIKCKIKMSQFTDIVDKHMMNLLGSYCQLYKKNPAAFISVFKKSTAVKMACEFIRSTCEHNGALQQAREETGKDFTEWCQRNTSERWVKVLNAILILIYSINNSSVK